MDDMISGIFRTILVEDGTIDRVCRNKKEVDIHLSKAINEIHVPTVVEGNVGNRD